ncbi:hypothetical protein D3C76_830370 [compost metagenome]
MGSDGMRHASMWIAPVPCARTFFATVPAKGLRAMQMGSCAGFNAVPQPSCSPDRLCDFGKPEPKTHMIWSRISKPAISMPTAMWW